MEDKIKGLLQKERLGKLTLTQFNFKEIGIMSVCAILDLKLDENFRLRDAPYIQNAAFTSSSREKNFNL